MIEQFECWNVQPSVKVIKFKTPGFFKTPFIRILHIKILSTILAIYGPINWTILAIYDPRNKLEPFWQFMAPEIANSWQFVVPETAPFW